MNKFLNEIKKCRKKLRSAKERKKFWQVNKANFERNVKAIVRGFSFPKKWKVYVATGSFLSNKPIMPYDTDKKWSATLLVATTKRQGFEIMMFLNKASLEFLSRPALIPLITHETEHVRQIARSPRKYLKGYFYDAASRKDEVEAEKKVRTLASEIRSEEVLEKILYCFDKGGWQAAQKMADFIYKKQPEAYGGGYDRDMTEKQYKLFLRSKKSKDIQALINQF